MNLTIPHAPLLAALSRAVPLCANNRTLPILSHVLLATHDVNRLTITATDLESGIQICVSATANDPGSVCVPGQKVYQIIKELSPDQDIRMSLDPDTQRLTILSGSSKFTLATMLADDFPSFVGTSDADLAEKDAKEFTAALESVSYAASRNESRFNMNVVCLDPDPDGEGTRLITTDGHRLAFALWPTYLNVPVVGRGGSDASTDSTPNQTKPILIPLSGVDTLTKTLASVSGNVQIGVDSKIKNLVVTTDTTTLSVRLLDGDFPSYGRVVPDTNSRLAAFQFDRDALLRSIRRVSVLSTDHSRGITFEMQTGLAKLSSAQTDMGIGTDTVKIQGTTLAEVDEPIIVIINGSYLLDALRVIPWDVISLEYYGEGSAIVMRCGDVENESDSSRQADFHLVMPMRK
jgi:DNA polymerase III subunit beta